jgi:D-sedoheptulose 7-phosphate isomerase
MDLKELNKALEDVELDKLDKLKELILSASQIIMIGNGGSNSICSHISQDYTKQLGKRAFGFSDPSRLTCYINDYGRDNAYRQFLSEFADEQTLVILISSSGNSSNILQCADFCDNKNISFIVLSGFKKDNPLKVLYTRAAQLEFWVDSCDYGVVECAHQAILHTAV